MTASNDIATASENQPATQEPGLKLDLGSGQNPFPGYTAVDKFGSPEIKADLEAFPWPWKDNSVEAARFNHVLEHMGATSDIFNGIMKELYRVCRNGAVIDIAVPHPRHDDFLSDPTHVRALMPGSFTLYSKRLNRMWQEQKAANSALGLYHDVDFEVEQMNLTLDELWLTELNAGRVTKEQIFQAARQFNNVIKSIELRLRVIKEG